MKKIFQWNWLKRFLSVEEENKKVEIVVSLSVQEVIEKLCLWGECDKETTDMSSVSLENGQEVLTVVIDKNDVAVLVVAEQQEQGAKVYLSINETMENSENVEKCLKEASDVLLQYIVEIEKE